MRHILTRTTIDFKYMTKFVYRCVACCWSVACNHILRLPPKYCTFKICFPVPLPAVTQAFVQPCLWLWKHSSFIFVFDFVRSRFLPFPLSKPSLYLSRHSSLCPFCLYLPSLAVFSTFSPVISRPLSSLLFQALFNLFSVFSSWDCIYLHPSLHHTSTWSLLSVPKERISYTYECLFNEMHVAVCMHHEYVCVCWCITLREWSCCRFR